jgi:hypothetical protein
MGSKGKIQGAKMVKTPATKEIAKKIIVLSLLEWVATVFA